ncbi:ribose transport system ATP-binding protein [Arcicella aurantiaca]|uniref:Ribose transport system ATP-binding protein n=1 Tax=Arcicella aurantiaca TaxID=591202 RepID=A0A316EDT9_9BACT|nr:sugar ABC transporter ATP-binding protein [Arcicella aurantiaca]PWK27540.1 ribose transport system ATP-binding protein [Arcicella aurantiaca]
MILQVQNITKRFSGVAALENVNLAFAKGKVTAVLGENGAGKSTLMKILSGVYPDYEGQIIYKNQSVHFANTKDAQNVGIAIIHQELNLIPYLSIQENIFLGRELTNSWGVLDKKAMLAKTSELLNTLKLSLNPETLVADLKIGQQQIIEIAKALLLDSEVIIMDEPTSAISDSEVEVLFSIINDLLNAGKSIIYISHKLDELRKIAHNYVILRDGKSIDSGELKDMTHDELIAKMVGREIKMMQRNVPDFSENNLLKVENLSLKSTQKNKDSILKDINFHLKKGEILGICGLMGAGRTELFETLFGLHPQNIEGKISINGSDCKFKKPSDAINAGLAFVTEDRKHEGLVLGMSVRENLSITTLKDLQKGFFVDEKAEVNLTADYIKTLNIKTSSQEQFVKNLSGGNQQKIVIAKWLATKPQILLLDEPTRGVDIGAKNEIYKTIVQLADEGLGIIVVSSELPEIMLLADRILVMAEGKITAEMRKEEATEDKILKAAII